MAEKKDKRSGLGPIGLEALFADIEGDVAINMPSAGAKSRAKRPAAASSAGTATPKNAVIYVDIDDIRPNSMQPRQTFKPEAIDELAASIESYGVIQPVILAKAKVGYELVAGERRWRAARKAGLKAVPAIVRKVTSEENALIAIIENMQREDLNTLEEASAYRAIIDKYGLTQETLARVVGKSRPHIANTLRVLAMSPDIQEFLRTGLLTLGHANALGAVKDNKKQAKLADEIAKKGLSVREAERRAAVLTTKKPARQQTKDSRTNEIRIIEHELTSLTGSKVVISGNGEKGSVELRYSDRQGLEEIIELLRKGATTGK